MSTDLLKRLMEAGTPVELVAEVADLLADARAAERILEKRRAADRDRKRAANPRIPRNSEEAAESAEFQETPPTPAPSFPPDPQSTPTHTPGDITPRARKAGDFPCPEGIDPQHWRDLLANRKTKRLTNTPTAYRQLLKDIEKFADDEWPPGRIVEFAAAAGWGAIFDPRNSYRTQQNGRSGPHPMGRNQSEPGGISSTARAALRVFGAGDGQRVPQ